MADKDERSEEPEVWTSRGFLEEFKRVHKTRPDQAFAFVLGSGASKTSGIPTGGELVESWLREMHRRYVEQDAEMPLAQWATAETLDIEDFEYERADEFYPDVYNKRFADADDGYAYLEDVMSNKEPSFGYSVLAHLLANERHKVVITTNFDNLVADALAIYTDTFPLVCGHESLTSFVRPQLRRPLVAKVHRSITYDPQSAPEDTNQLHSNWEPVLRDLLGRYTPVVIGYGGNDGSFMGFLEKQMSQKGPRRGMFWCYRRADGPPRSRIKAIVAGWGGKLVPVEGFDELMLQISGELELSLMDGELERKGAVRVKAYREQVQKLRARLATPAPDAEAERERAEAREAMESAVGRQSDENWWAWVLRADDEEDPDRAEELFREALARFPDVPEIKTAAGGFLGLNGKEEEGEALLRQAAADAPHLVHALVGLAAFLFATGGRAAEPEELLRRALALDAGNAEATVTLANVLWEMQGRGEAAELLYLDVLQERPDMPGLLQNLAEFSLVREALPDARKYAARAWQIMKGADVCLFLALVERMTAGDDSTALGRLKTCLKEPLPMRKRFWRTTKSLVGLIEGALDGEAATLYKAALAATTDRGHLPRLEGLPEWQAVIAKPLDSEWEEYVAKYARL